jgi:hypothetical protein
MVLVIRLMGMVADVVVTVLAGLGEVENDVVWGANVAEAVVVVGFTVINNCLKDPMPVWSVTWKDTKAGPQPANGVPEMTTLRWSSCRPGGNVAIANHV